MKKILFTLAAVSAVLVLLGGWSVRSAADRPDASPVKTQTDVWDPVVGKKSGIAEPEFKVVTRRYVASDKQRRFEIKAEYPELQIEPETSPAVRKLNQLVRSRIMSEIEEFKKTMAEISSADREFLPKNVNYYMTIGYRLEYADAELVSLVFARDEYTGGAHPNNWFWTLNFDLKRSRTLKLADLFKPQTEYLQLISDHSRRSLLGQQGSEADADWIGRGAGPQSENFIRWAVTGKGLKFLFNNYQVAPYYMGSFEVDLPFEKIPGRMQSELFQLAQKESLVDGNPANWCRGGLWTAGENKLFRIATVSGRKNERAYFYTDERDCPADAGCRRKAYVIAGDEVIVNRTYGEFACSWFQPQKGTETVGWLRLDQLTISETGPADNNGWVGEWFYAGNNIRIEPAEKGGNGLRVTGNAFWQGLGDNIHIGELDYAGTPSAAGTLEVSSGADQYDCRVRLQRLGRYLIVSDNLNCGGVNVTFNGIYQKK